MKWTFKPLHSLLALGLVTVGVVVVSHAGGLGRDNPLSLAISKEPLNRQARTGLSFAPVVKKVSPSVVNIYSTRFIRERQFRHPILDDPVFRQFFGGRVQGDDRERIRREQGLGSGVIVSVEGYILTANHVVADADEIKVGVPGSKTEYTAKVIGKDRGTDIAVLKIQGDNLPAVTLGDSDQLEVGDVVLALGNPFGVGQTVTMGIVSALERSGLAGFNQYQNFIQTDAAINPGNSGGALVDAEGRLVGINTAIISRTGGNQGIGLAVPINMARNVLERFVSGGRIARGYIGIVPQDINAGLARQFGLPNEDGALVADVMPGTPAAKAGIKSGDVIVAVNDKPVTDARNLQLTISEMNPGSQVTLKIYRGGAKKTVGVVLGELPGGTVIGAEDEPVQPEAHADALDGVMIAELNPYLRQQLRMPDGVNGVIVTDVAPDSNSAEAGLLPNDVILEINRQPANTTADAVRLGKAARDGQILLKIWRRGADFSGTRFLSVDNTRRQK